MKRKGILWGMAGLGVFLCLVLLLTAAEDVSPEASIHTFGDALWYALVTLTTVGYGDLYPVTPTGRMIGGALVLMSMGLLAAVISGIISLLTGRLLPGLALYSLRHRDWFVFSAYNEASKALATDLTARYPEGVCIFGGAETGKLKRQDCLFLSREFDEILSLAIRGSGKRTVFLMKPDPMANAKDALTLRGGPAAVFCLGPENPLLEEVSFFNPAEMCARLYWQEHPLEERENCVLLIGSGEYAQALLENALLSQARQPFYRCEYHLFGDWNRWRGLHPVMDQTLAINENRQGMDSLYFHEGDWFCDPALVEGSQRVILCHDDERENIQDALAFSRFFGGNQALYVRAAQGVVPGLIFGQTANLYTAEYVMKQSQDALARGMHESYRARHPEVLAWERLDPFTRASNRAVADHAPMKKRLLGGEKYADLSPERREKMRRCEHDRWMRFYSLYNWRFGETKDAACRRHPCMVSYEQLNAVEKAKDDYAWQLTEEKP